MLHKPQSPEVECKAVVSSAPRRSSWQSLLIPPAHAGVGSLQLLRFAACALARARALRVPTLSTSAGGFADCAANGAVGAATERPRTKKAASVSEVAGQFVFKSQLFFLEAVEKVFVGVGSVLFFLDESVKSLVLGFEFLGNCLVHWCRSFHVRESPTHNKTRIVALVLTLLTPRRPLRAARREPGDGSGARADELNSPANERRRSGAVARNAQVGASKSGRANPPPLLGADRRPTGARTSETAEADPQGRDPAADGFERSGHHRLNASRRPERGHGGLPGSTRRRLGRFQQR
jgi:hypothetical protein